MDPITISVGGIVGFVILVITIVSIAGNPNHGGFGKFMWILVAIVFSVFGSIAWLLFGRGKVRR